MGYDYVVLEKGFKCDCKELMKDFNTQDLEGSNDVYTITPDYRLKKNDKHVRENVNFTITTECIRCGMFYAIHVFFKNGKLEKMEVSNKYIIDGG